MKSAIEKALAEIVSGIPALVFRRVEHPDGRIDWPFLGGRDAGPFGLPPDGGDIHGAGLEAFVHVEDRAKLSDAFAASEAELSEVAIELRLIPASGEACWYDVTAHPRRTPAGGTEWDGVALDSGRRHRRDERLRLLERVSLAIAEAVDFDTALGVVLRLVCKTMAWPYGEAWVPDKARAVLVAGPVWHEADPTLAAFALRRRTRTYQAGEGFIGEVWRTGHHQWVDDLAAYLRTSPRSADLVDQLALRTGYTVPVPSGGEVAAVLAFAIFESHPPDHEMFRTVAAICAQLGGALQRKRAEQALRREAQLLKAAQNAARIGIWISSREGDIQWSDEVYRIFGVTPDEFDGRVESFCAMVHPEDQPVFKKSVYDALAQGLPYTIDHRIVRRDGTVRWVCEHCGTVPNDDGLPDLFVGVCRDITESRRALEREAQSERLAAIGVLTGGVAHNFNNLLAVICGNLELVLEQPDDAAQVTELAEAALEAARRGAALTSCLLAYSHQQPLAARLVQVNELLADLARTLAKTLSRTELRLVLDPALWTVAIDPVQLEAAISNLVANAADAMPSGGTITIATANEHISEPRAMEVGEAAAGDYVRIDVTDTGSGIPTAIRTRIFEPFFTTKPNGTGLGLSMVGGFVRQSGGEVEVETTPGKGTTVRLYLARSR